MSERINLEMSFLDGIIVMAEGNPGALTAIAELTKLSPKVDPQSYLGMWTPLLSLDGDGIYGSDIWLLYKDVCKQSAIHCLAVLRAVQLGIVNISQVKLAMERNAHEVLDIDSILAQVKTRLASFGGE
jgi:hypothetical protein